MTTIEVVKGGHIPFDDNPMESHGALMKWLEKKVVKSRGNHANEICLLR